LLDQFINSSTMNVERIPESLRKELHIHTQMDEVCSQAVEIGCSIVVAGTAGSGKTHLVKQLCSTNTKMNDYEVLLDLTAEKQMWPRILNEKKFIICGNEGIFDIASTEDQRFKKIVTDIHCLQNGIDPKTKYLLLDASGFNHINTGVLKKVMQLRILNEYRDHYGDKIDRAFWNLLKSDKVISRLEKVLIKASIYSDASMITMREFWRFICELINCSRSKPGPNDWVRNLFYGKTEISNMIRHFSDFGQYAIPIIGTRISLGDLDFLDQYSIPEFKEVRKYFKPQSGGSSYTPEELNILRLLALFVLVDSPLDGPTGQTKDLWERINFDEIKNSDLVCSEILEKINDYLSYGLGSELADFELFCDYRLEYKLKKSNHVISQGSIPKKNFKFTKNMIHSSIKGVESIDSFKYGNRYFLKYEEVSLRINKQVIDKILEKRSSRTYDSIGAEIDWRLLHFNEQLATNILDSKNNAKKLLFVQRETRGKTNGPRVIVLKLSEPKDQVSIFVEHP